jgi:anti-sigma factor RsiW
MKQRHTPEDLIERYLLGELSTTEQIALEDAYFIDQAKYDQLCKTEDELIDRYARGALSLADRERFERCYLTNPRRRRHVKFAKALTQVIDGELTARSTPQRTSDRRQIESPDTDTSWRSRLVVLARGPRFALGLTLIIAALLIVFGGTWFAIETSRLRARIAEAEREAEMQRRRAQTQAGQIAALEAQSRQLTEERERLQSQLQVVKETGASFHGALAPVFLTLSINAFRDSGGREPRALMIPNGVKEARLRLNLLENLFPAYRVTLLTADGSEVFSKAGLRPRAGKAGDFVIVSLPADKFRSGDNVLALSGISSTGEVEPLGKAIIKVRRR